MVDTLSITYKTDKVNTDSLISKGWDYRLNIVGGQGSEVFYKDIKDKRYFYYYPNSLLRVEFSSPNVLFGNNYTLVRTSDIPLLKDKLNTDDVINYFSPISDASVSRVDFVLNFRVGDTSKYIQSFSNINVPRMTKSVYNDSQTVFFKNSRRAFRIYDKYSECKVEEARGILRFEVQLRGKYLNDNLSSRSFDDVVNFNTAVYFLSDSFNILRAGYQCFTSDIVLNILFSKFKSTYATTLYGFYVLVTKFGLDYVKRIYSTRTYYRYLRVYNDLGLRLYNDVVDSLDFKSAISELVA